VGLSRCGLGAVHGSILAQVAAACRSGNGFAGCAVRLPGWQQRCGHRVGPASGLPPTGGRVAWRYGDARCPLAATIDPFRGIQAVNFSAGQGRLAAVSTLFCGSGVGRGFDCRR